MNERIHAPVESQVDNESTTVHFVGEASAPLSDTCLENKNQIPDNVIDSNSTRAQITRELLKHLVHPLGLRPDGFTVRCDEEARRQVSTENAIGTSFDQTIFLHPNVYDPGQPAGRYLLAHELAHVAQRSATPPRFPEGALRSAELEAHRIGQSVVEGRIPKRPRVRLPLGSFAADAGFARLDTKVEDTRAREIEEIKELLSGIVVSDGDVENIFRILEDLAFFTAREIVFALMPEERVTLADNVSKHHFDRYRREALASFSALEPESIKEFDSGLFDGMDWNFLSPVEHQAILYVFSNMTQESLKELLDSDARAGVMKVMQSSPSAAKLADERERAINREKQRKADHDAETANREKFENDSELNALAKKLIEDLDEWIVTDGEATEVLVRLSELRSEPDKLDYVLEKMEQAEVLDVLLEELPDSARQEPESNRETFKAVVLSRPVEKNIAFVENLLSYSLFDWAIREWEALLAYEIIKVLPLEAQDRFRKIDGGKWFLRMEGNVNEDLIREGVYKSVEVGRDENGELVDLSEKYGALIAEGAGQEAVDEIIALIEKGIDEKSARKIYRKLAGLGVPVEKDDSVSSDLRDAVVRQLDRLGYIDTLFDEIPDSILFSEVNTPTTLKIMLARDPVHIERHARKLLRQGFFNVVTAKDAFLAFQLVKALPDEERARFFAEDGGELYGRIFSEMTGEMRRSADLNNFVGDRKGMERASVLAQLADKGLWVRERMAELDGLIRMAIAMGEHEFVFGQSKKFTAYKDAKLKKSIVDKFKLYDKNSRVKFVPTVHEGTGILQEGVFQTLRAAGNYVALFFNQHIILRTRSVGVNKLNPVLREFQEAGGVQGGDVSGIRFADLGEKVNAPDEDYDFNKGPKEVRWDVGKGLLEVDIPETPIESINFPFGDSKFQSGRVELKGLKVKMGYSADGFERPAFIDLDLDSLNLKDILFIQQESMMGINEVDVKPIHFNAGVKDTEPVDAGKTRDGYYIGQIPIFAVIVGGFINLGRIISFSDGIGLDLSSVNQDIDTLRSLKVEIGHLKVDGITLGGGQHIAQVDVRNATLAFGGNQATYLRALIESLKERIKKAKQKPNPPKEVTEWEKLLHESEKELKTVEPKEQELIELQRSYQKDKDSLSPKEHSRLIDLQKDLKGGVVTDIGEISAQGIKGNVNMKGFKLKNLHGHGQSASAGLPFLTNEALAEQFLKQDPNLSNDKRKDKTSFKLELDRFETTDFNIRSIPDPEDVADSLKTIKEKLEEEPYHPGLKKRKDYLTVRLADAKRYHFLAAKLQLFELSEDEFGELAEVRNRLLAKPDFEIDSVVLERVKVSAGLDEGKAGLSAGRIDALGIRADGRRVGRFQAKEFHAGASFEGGLQGILDLRKSLKQADVGAKSLVISDIEDRDSRLKIKKITVTDLDAGLDAEGNDDSAYLKAGSIVVEGLTISTAVTLLRAIKAHLEQKRAEDPKAFPEKEAAKLKEIEKELSDLDELLKLRTLTETALIQAKKTNDPEKIREQEDRVESVKFHLDRWLNKVSVGLISLHDLNVVVSGLGDVLAGDIRINDGVRIEPGEDGGKFFSQLQVKDTRVRNAKGDETTVAGIDIGPVGGTIDYSENEIRIQNFTIGAFSVTGLLYNAGRDQIYSDGTSTLSDIQVDATIKFVKDESGEAKRRLSEIRVQRFWIGTVTADDLGYYNGEKELTVEVRSGGLSGVWMDDVRLNIPEGEGKLTYTGSAGITSVDNLKLHSSMTGVFRKAGGNLSGKDLQVNFLRSGKKVLKIGDLNFRRGHLIAEDGKVFFDLKHLTTGKSGFIEQDGDRIRVSGLELGELKVKSFNWTAKGMKFSSNKPTVISKTQANVTYNTKTGEVSVDDFQINSITSEHFKIKAGPKVIEIRPPKKKKDEEPEKKPPLEIIDVHLRGMKWHPKKSITQRGELDVKTIHTDIALDFGKDLDLGVTLDAEGLHMAFEVDGQVVTRIDDLDVGIDGTVKGVKVGARIKDLETGDIVYGNNKITIPSMEIPKIFLDHLTVDSKSISVGVPDTSNGFVKFFNTYVGLTINLYSDEEKKTAADAGKELPSFKNITIDNFQIRLANMMNLKVVLKDLIPGKPLTIEVPDGRVGILKDLWLHGLDPKNPFVIEPNVLGDMEMKGTFLLSEANVKGLAAQLSEEDKSKIIGENFKKILDVKTDLKVETLKVNFLGAGKKEIDITKITLENIKPTFEGSDLLVRLGSAVISDVVIDDKGVDVGGVGLTDFILDTDPEDKNVGKGIRIVVQKATLPKGVKIPEGDPVKIEEFKIQEASFDIDDLWQLIEGDGKGGGGSGGGVKDLKFLDTLNGSIKLNLILDLDYIGGLNRDIKINIQNGKISIPELEDQTGAEDIVLDLETKDNNLVLEADFTEVGAAAGTVIPIIGTIPGGIVGAILSQDLVTWGLTQEDLKLLEEKKQVKLSTLADKDKITLSDLLTGSEGGDSDDPFLNYIAFRNVDVNLGMRKDSAIDLGKMGKIKLGTRSKDGLSNFKVTGDSDKKAGLAISLGELNFALEDFMIKGLGIDTGLLQIKNVKDTRLTFHDNANGWKPKHLEGTITEATGKNIFIKK